MEKAGFVFFAGLLLFSAALIACVYVNQTRCSRESPDSFKREAMLEAFGAWFLGLSFDGIEMQSIFEKNYGSMADIPGGYNGYQAADVVGPPLFAGYSFYVTRIAPTK